MTMYRSRYAMAMINVMPMKETMPTIPLTIYHFSLEAASSIVHENCVKISASSFLQLSALDAVL